MRGEGADFSALGGRDGAGDGVLRLDLNTGPHPVGLVPRLVQRLAHIEEYGPERADELRSRLAQLHTPEPAAGSGASTGDAFGVGSSGTGIDADNIVLGAGSMDLLRMAVVDLAGESGTAVVQVPGYPGFRRLCSALGVPMHTVPRGEGFATDSAGLMAAAAEVEGPVLAYLNHPVNPVGVPEDLTVIDTLLDVRPDIRVVVDEAYADFHTGADSLRVSAAAGDERLVVTRSFSKARGLAGIRLGYAVAGLRTAQRWRDAQLPGAISGLTQAAALASLDEDSAAFAARMAELVGRRESLAHDLQRILGVRPVPSWANFLLVPLGGGARAVAAELAAAGIAVKLVVDEPGLPESLRITVGDDYAHRRVVAALEGYGHDG